MNRSATETEEDLFLVLLSVSWEKKRAVVTFHRLHPGLYMHVI